MLLKCYKNASIKNKDERSKIDTLLIENGILC